MRLWAVRPVGVSTTPAMPKASLHAAFVAPGVVVADRADGCTVRITNHAIADCTNDFVVGSFDVVPDRLDRAYVVVGDQGSMVARDRATNAVVATFDGLRGYTKVVARPDGGWLLGTQSGLVELRDASLRLDRTVADAKQPVDRVALISAEIVAYSVGNTLYVQEVRGERKLEFTAEKEIDAISPSPDGRYVAVGDVAGVVTMFDTSTWRAVRSQQLDSGVLQVAFSADSSRVAVATMHGRLVLWSLKEDQIELSTPAAEATFVTFAPTGDSVAFVKAEHEVCIGTIPGYRWKCLDLSRDRVRMLAYSRDGEEIVAPDSGGRLSFIDVDAALQSVRDDASH